MIINLIIKYQTSQINNKVVYKAIIKKSDTTNTFVDRVVCKCGESYPKLIELSKVEYLVPIEVNYREDISVEIEGETPAKLLDNCIAYIINKTNAKHHQVYHGAKASIHRVFEYDEQCRKGHEESTAP